MSERLPPGQRWIDEPIVYDIAHVPPIDSSEARLHLAGAVANELVLTRADLDALPRVSVVRDFHCVTGWSVKDVGWAGVSTRTLVSLAQPLPEVTWVLAVCREGYTTSVSYEHFADGDSLVASHMNGVPLRPEHGHPLRLVVPSLYAWKYAKYLTELRFLTELRRGFWEERGYHDVGDPWREERFRGRDDGMPS
jgi:DMSO/TMAO reductase YedYZ molybdopterin-dependent catalytic subunit